MFPTVMSNVAFVLFLKQNSLSNIFKLTNLSNLPKCLFKCFNFQFTVFTKIFYINLCVSWSPFFVVLSTYSTLYFFFFVVCTCVCLSSLWFCRPFVIVSASGFASLSPICLSTYISVMFLFLLCVCMCLSLFVLFFFLILSCLYQSLLFCLSFCLSVFSMTLFSFSFAHLM